MQTDHTTFQKYMKKGFKQQNWPSGSLKVIGIHANQQAIHDFLLVFCFNYVCSLKYVACTISEIVSFISKIYKGHMMITMPIQGTICYPEANTWHGQSVYEIWNL